MLTFEVLGMTCDHCTKAVARAAAACPGVERVVSVDLAKGELVVEGAPDVVALARAIEDEGYVARRTT